MGDETAKGKESPWRCIRPGMVALQLVGHKLVQGQQSAKCHFAVAGWCACADPADVEILSPML